MNKKQFNRICSEYGITDVDVYQAPTGGWDGQAWSPVGKTFLASGCHCCVHQTYTDTKGYIYSALADDIKSGLTECDDEECEYCEKQ